MMVLGLVLIYAALILLATAIILILPINKDFWINDKGLFS